jgi:hypothetical protein
VSGKHIELFLVDGTPGGLTTAEIIGWTGHVLAAGRGELGDLLRRQEAARNGVYLLMSDDDEAIGGTRCYIGKTEVIGDRLKQHVSKKEFWDRVVVITTKDDTFTEGHWGYLEARLVSLAKEAKRVALENGNEPRERKLSEAQVSDMEAFISQLQVILPVLGVHAIRVRPPKALTQAGQSTESPVFTLRSPRLNVEAHAQQIDGEFTVLAGSSLVAKWSGGEGKEVAESTRKAYAKYRAQHEALLADGAIVVESGVGRLTRDVVFSSPSTAGAVAWGHSCNGRREWISTEGTFGDWESRGIE